MRSFVALMTCIGCIAWVHSCDKRLLGVQLERNNIISDQPRQLPVAILPAAIPAQYISQIRTGSSIISAVTPRTRAGRVKKKANTRKAADSLLFNLALVRGQYTISNNSTP